MEQRTGGILQRLKQAPPWVWISIAIAGAGLVVAFLVYRNQANGGSGAATNGTANASVPANGTATPNYSTAGGSTAGGYDGYGSGYGFAPDIQAELQQLIQLLQNQQNGVTTPTPNPPGTPNPNPNGIQGGNIPWFNWFGPNNPGAPHGSGRFAAQPVNTPPVNTLGSGAHGMTATPAYGVSGAGLPVNAVQTHPGAGAAPRTRLLA